MKATYNQHIGLYEGYVPDEYCDWIVETFEQNLDKTQSRREWENAPSNEKQDRAISFTEQLPDEYSKPIRDLLLKTLIPEYGYKYPLFEDDIRMFKGIGIPFVKVQKTLPGEGYHIWHTEFSYFGEGLTRGLVWTLYLNDVEEGGETEFLHQHLRIKPKKGLVCLFPPYYTHTHRGNTPLSGVKYLMTGWANYNILNMESVDYLTSLLNQK